MQAEVGLMAGPRSPYEPCSLRAHGPWGGRQHRLKSAGPGDAV